jgi:hypothetical protein
MYVENNTLKMTVKEFMDILNDNPEKTKQNDNIKNKLVDMVLSFKFCSMSIKQKNWIT